MGVGPADWARRLSSRSREIVAGRRRFLAAKKLDARGAPDADKLPCVVLEADDDATAIEASLAENVERLPMDDLEQYEAFAALRKKGLGEADIAAHFAISEQVVRRASPSPTCIPTSAASTARATSTVRPCSI